MACDCNNSCPVIIISMIDFILFNGYEQPLQIYGQYKMSLNGEVAGIEVLLRPHSNDRSVVEIIEHVEVNEETHELSMLIMENAIRQLEGLCNAGVNVQMSINIAPDSLCKSVVDDVARLLHEVHVPAYLLTFEVTERQPIKAEGFMALHELAMLGVNIALDDFGVGYADMKMLDKIRKHGKYITEVKLDKMFLDDFDKLQNIVKELMDKGYKVTVEGVETKEQLNNLPENVIVQGYVYSVPKPLSQLIGELKKVDINH